MTSKARFSQLLPLHTHCIIHVHKTTLKKLYKRQRSRSFGSFMRSKAKVQLTPNRQNVWVQETTTDGNMYSQLYQQPFSYPQVMDISEYSDKIRQKREGWENCLYLSLVLYSIKNPAGNPNYKLEKLQNSKRSPVVCAWKWWSPWRVKYC